MSKGILVVIAVLAVILVLAGVAGWLVRRRPLALHAWSARQSLRGGGLKQVTVPSPVGPQTVFVGGSGPVLVLLHGAGDHAGTWSRVVPALVKGHTLVIPDLAGHGESAPATGPIDTAAVVAGLEAVLADQLKGRPATLVGNSLGAWMAMVLASRQPERVARVVAVNGGALQGSGSAVNLLPKTREEARTVMAQLRDPGSAALPDYVLDDLVRTLPAGSLARFAGTWASMGAWILTEAQLGTLKPPVRLVWGVSDQLMPMAYAQRLLAALPGAVLIPVAGCGHVPQQEAPGRFLPALEQALTN
jgi:pimeloyl-ACP methyl ester carboxylesterase